MRQQRLPEVGPQDASRRCQVVGIEQQVGQAGASPAGRDRAEIGLGVIEQGRIAAFEHERERRRFLVLGQQGGVAVEHRRAGLRRPEQQTVAPQHLRARGRRRQRQRRRHGVGKIAMPASDGKQAAVALRHVPTPMVGAILSMAGADATVHCALSEIMRSLYTAEGR